MRALWRYKVWWLTPLVIALLGFVGLLLLGADSGGPRVYPNF